MKPSLLLRLAAAILASFGVLNAPCLGEEILLWPPGHEANGKAVSLAGDQEHIVVRQSPSIVAMFPPDDRSSGAAVIVCPGGGYSILAFEKEGLEIGRWLNERGIAAFCLKYRCGGPPNGHPAPLDDARRAMRLVRSRTAEWRLDPDKVGIMGFSAGGHLAACTSTLGDEGNPEADDPIERYKSRPDFSLLVYPVISMADDVTHGGSRQTLLGEAPSSQLIERLSADHQVNKQTPPAFLVHASDDRPVPVENSLRYYRALIAHDLPAEMHIFASGGHGFGMRPTGQPVDQWPELADKWLRRQGLVK